MAFAGKDKSAELVNGGRILEVPSGTLEDIMGYEEIIISVDLGLDNGSATAWGCDLSYDYVRINVDYTT